MKWLAFMPSACKLNFALNACVSSGELWISFPLKQITGMAGLTPQALGSCGNDWDPEGDPQLTQHLPTFQKLAYTIGKRLQASGFQGVFGIDLINLKYSGTL